jgi:penicillin-binding protein 1A
MTAAIRHAAGDTFFVMRKKFFGRFLKILSWCAVVVAILLLAGTITASVLYRRYEKRAAEFDLTKIDDMPERSAVYDANGELYSRFGGENRLVVPLSSVSEWFIKALLAREDARFWKHRGIDYRSTLRAVLVNVRAGETKQGASTITQQLARNVCDLRARTLDRKALEAMLARRIEATYSKQQILEIYVNRIYFGAGFYGIESAARGYFGKAAADLTPGEAATLAGLIRSPQRLAPTRDMDAALQGRDAVLARMIEIGTITADEAAAAKAQNLKLAKDRGTRVSDDSVMDAVLREAATLVAPETLDYGGLSIFATIDPQLQGLAQAAADRRLTEIEEQKGYPHPRKRDFVPSTKPDEEEKPTDYLQTAVVIVENRTGAIRALIGGRDYEQSKYCRALLARRQVGSTFKPFVYAAAFERGLLPGSLIDDAKILPGEFRDLPKKWSPENSDGEYGGQQPAALGLIKSRNTMSVRVGEFAGLEKVRTLGQEAGVSDTIPDLPVVFLGGFETTARDLASAYTVFPNLGVRRASYLISSIEDRDGHVLWKAPTKKKQVLSPESAWMVSGLLQQVMKSGTAAKAASLGWKKIGAGKTGTTNDFFDAWFVGYTSSLTCAVWVGMDHPQTILEKGYGSALALPIWVDIMLQVPEQRHPSAPFEPPSPLVKVTLCSVSGGRATSACVAQGFSYECTLPASRVPGESCRTHPEPPAQPVVAAEPPVAIVPAPTPPTSASPPVPQAIPPPVTAAPPPVTAVAQVPRSTPARPLADAPETYLENNQRTPEPAARPPALSASPPARPSRTPSTALTESARPVETPDAPDRIERPRQVEVRRATPVTPNADESQTEVGSGVTERVYTERTPDGRIRTTTVRTIRSPATKPEMPRKKEFRLFNHDDG